MSTNASSGSRRKNSHDASVFDSHASRIMVEARLSTSLVHTSTTPVTRLTAPARHTEVTIAHISALPNGTRSRPSWVVTSL
ncbi:hypothetical protein BCUN_2240 [Bifidobacterium cuniculi]|uniref:Uncharacterized protein n=1 Tax=Bifidobacterium cuniculi TaxID=1688 RepID=A0A087AC35_9BIFI|nr:hypothetical protein BCUN_2240 [Bifidobacterium cuniculi]